MRSFIRDSFDDDPLACACAADVCDDNEGLMLIEGDFEKQIPMQAS
jgi:hypothetical protein